MTAAALRLPRYAMRVSVVIEDESSIAGEREIDASLASDWRTALDAARLMRWLHDAKARPACGENCPVIRVQWEVM